MSSIKTERKLSSWFWWILTALPLLIILGYLISSILNFNTQGGTPLDSQTIWDYWDEFNISWLLDSPSITYLMDLIPNSLSTSMENLLDVMGVGDTYFYRILSWGIAMQLYRILFDFACLLPRLARKYLNRGFGVND